MPYIQASHRFHYTHTSGSGRPIVLIHSTGIGSRQWAAYSKLIDRPLLAIDLLGYPPSDPWEASFSISADLEGTEKLVLHQEQPVDLIGHSYGGFIAMQLAHKNPSAIDSMLLHEPVAWGSLYSSDRADLKEEFDQVCDSFFSHRGSIDPDSWLNGFVDFWNVPGIWANLPEKTKAIWRKQFHKVFAEVSSLCLDRTPLSHWATIKHPTWITMSSGAPEPEKEVCRLLSETMPGAKLLKHSGGHLSPITHFSELSPIINRWLEL